MRTSYIMHSALTISTRYSSVHVYRSHSLHHTKLLRYSQVEARIHHLNLRIISIIAYLFKWIICLLNNKTRSRNIQCTIGTKLMVDHMVCHIIRFINTFPNDIRILLILLQPHIFSLSLIETHLKLKTFVFFIAFN